MAASETPGVAVPPYPPSASPPKEEEGEENEEGPVVLPPLLQELLLRDPGTPPELEEAEAAMRASRQQWLKWEILWRLLGELVIEGDPGLSYEELQALGQLRGEPTEPPENLPPFCRLVPLLELRLAEKISEIDQYWSPGDDVTAPQDDVTPPQDVAAALANQKLQLAQAQRHQQQLSQSLQELREAYAQALSRCLGLLTQLQEVATQWGVLDQTSTQYLEAKGRTIQLKTRLEELQLLLDTYPALTVEAHRVIRARLREALNGAQEEVERLQSRLSSLAALGPAFSSLAEEFGRLRQRVRERRWALQQLQPSST